MGLQQRKLAVVDLDSVGEGLRRLEADGGSRSVVSAEEGLRDSPKGIWHRALCVVAGRRGCDFRKLDRRSRRGS